MNVYVVVNGLQYQVRSERKVVHKGTLARTLDGLSDFGMLAGEIGLCFKTPRLPVVLEVIKGGLSSCVKL